MSTGGSQKWCVPVLFAHTTMTSLDLACCLVFLLRRRDTTTHFDFSRLLLEAHLQKGPLRRDIQCLISFFCLSVREVDIAGASERGCLEYRQ